MRSTLPLLLSLVLACPIARADDTDDLLRRAREAYSQGNPTQAAQLADDAVTKARDDPRPLRFRASLHEALRQFDRAIADYDALLTLTPDDPNILQDRGSAHFRAGHIEESLKDFDRYLALRPAEKPQHWQRGIALYYAGKFDEGAKQFELHRTVNADDVENAAWHYLCLARSQGLEKARAALIPIARDDRAPMMQVHAMYAGKLTPDQVLDAARAGNPPPRQLKRALFYAHLYIALFHEAAGKADLAKHHVTLAATDYAETDYMSDVARVHLAQLK